MKNYFAGARPTTHLPPLSYYCSLFASSLCMWMQTKVIRRTTFRCHYVVAEDTVVNFFFARSRGMGVASHPVAATVILLLSLQDLHACGFTLTASELVCTHRQIEMSTHTSCRISSDNRRFRSSMKTSNSSSAKSGVCVASLRASTRHILPSQTQT